MVGVQACALPICCRGGGGGGRGSTPDVRGRCAARADGVAVAVRQLLVPPVAGEGVGGGVGPPRMCGDDVLLGRMV